MSGEAGLVFQAISAASAIVTALRAGLEIRKLTREEILNIASEADLRAASDQMRIEKAEKELTGVDEDMERALREKCKKFRKSWEKIINDSDDPSHWAQATDELKASQCALLRNLKQLAGGKLPGEWYRLWTDLQCG